MRPGTVVAAILVVGLLSARAGRASEPPPGTPPGFVPGPSIHQQEWRKHQGRPLPEPAEPLRLLAAPSAPSVSALTRIVYGFLPYWVVADLSHIRWPLLSHVAYFSVDLNPDGSLTNRTGSYAWPSGAYVAALRSTAHANGVKVVLTATCFSSSSITTLLSSATNRQNAIDNLKALVQGAGDGVNIDMEGVPLSQKANLVTFMTDLTAALHTAVPGSHVSVCTPAVDWSGAFDYDQLAVNSDGLFIMGYDYWWSGSSTAGPCAPLTSGGTWGTYNVTWTIADYMTWGGSANRSRFILGVPYYGYEWPTTSTGVPSTTTATGTSKTYDTARANAASYGRLWDAASQTPYYVYSAGGAHQGWYDDAESLGYKWDLVNANDLGGTGIWALEYDTADGLLWSQIQAKFTYDVPTVTPPAPVTLEQTACCGGFGGATPAGSGTLLSFVDGGTATDPLDPSPVRLAAQVNGVDVTGDTCFPAGETTVTFRFRNASGHVGTATAGATVRMFGDLNLDAAIDPADMVVLRAYFNFVLTPGTAPFLAPLGIADLDHDAAVDPTDMVLLRGYLNLAVACLAP